MRQDSVHGTVTRGQRYAGDFTAKRIARGDDPVASLDAFLDGFRRELLRNRVVLFARLDRHGDDGTTWAKVGAARTPAAFARRRTLLHSPEGSGDPIHPAPIVATGLPPLATRHASGVQSP